MGDLEHKMLRSEALSRVRRFEVKKSINRPPKTELSIDV